MPKILALDTSTDACSVALSLDNGAIDTDFRIIPRQHTVELLPMIKAILDKNGMKIAELDAIAFGRGPGSFAGIRIATGVTQGLAYAANIPVIPVSTLKALAQAVIIQEPVSKIAAALDARMDEIYIGTYRYEKGKIVSETIEQVCNPTELRLHQQEYLAVGSGWRYFDKIPAATQKYIKLSDQVYYPAANHILELAIDKWQVGSLIKAHEALPIYLRDNVAKKKKSLT